MFVLILKENNIRDVFIFIDNIFKSVFVMFEFLNIIKFEWGFIVFVSFKMCKMMRNFIRWRIGLFIIN